MTDDEALQIIRYGSGWVDWNNETDKPDWYSLSIVLDGTFTAKELLAILHFAPKDE